MAQKFRKSDKLLLKDWMKFHPYKSADAVDHYYYSDIARKIQKAILSINQSAYLYANMTDEEINRMACYLGCYFEDIISQAGMWQTFTREHFELYGRYLPFYDTTEYYPDEINQQDVCFLIWYFFSLTFRDFLINPANEDIVNLAQDVMEIFDQEYETALENERLKSYLNIPSDAYEGFKVSGEMQEWYFFNSYLFHFHETELNHQLIGYMDENEAELKEKKENGTLEEEDIKIFREEVDFYSSNLAYYFLFDYRTPLLSKRGNEWLAALVGSEHPLYNDFMCMQKRDPEGYIHTGEDEHYIHFKSIKDDTDLPVLKKSMENTDLGHPEGDLFIMSVLRFNEEWWLMEIYYSFEYTEQMKKELAGKKILFDFFHNQEAEDQVLVRARYKYFLKFTEGKQLLFFKDSEELIAIYERWTKYLGKVEKLSKEEQKQILDNHKADIMDSWVDDEEASGFLFYNPNHGLEFYAGINDIIPDEDNPEYDENQDSSDIIELMISEGCSDEMARFILDKYEFEPLQFPMETNTHMLEDNKDFMLRFWKSDFRSFL